MFKSGLLGKTPLTLALRPVESSLYSRDTVLRSFTVSPLKTMTSETKGN